MNIKRIVVFLTIIATIALGNCFTSFAQEKKSEPVTLRMNWVPTIDFVFYVIGLKKGFYREKGIELSIKWAKGSELSTKAVANRVDEFASASADTTLMAYIKGMPIKVLAIMHQMSPVSVISLKETNLSKPKDLEGKSLASDISSMKHTQFKAFCKLNQVDMDKIKIVPIKGSDLTHILNRSVNSMLAFGYIGDALLRKKGYEINEIKLSDYGIDVYGLSLITNENLIKENPGLVKRFVAATIKSWNYAISHPEEAVDALVEAYPELQKEDQLLQIAGVISSMQNNYTKEHGLGYQAKEEWKKMQDLLYSQGLIDKKVDLTKVYTNEFLP